MESPVLARTPRSARTASHYFRNWPALVSVVCTASVLAVPATAQTSPADKSACAPATGGQGRTSNTRNEKQRSPDPCKLEIFIWLTGKHKRGQYSDSCAHSTAAPRGVLV